MAAQIRRFWWTPLWLLALAVPGESQTRSEPRPLSAAERQAVALAADYFAHGPEVWWDRLASTAPLRRLGRDAALAEIAVRTGPVQGAVWRLQTPAARHGGQVAIFTVAYPSGLDETLILELVDEDGFKIHRLRCLADPLTGAPSVERLAGLAPLREVLAGTRRDDPEPLLRQPRQGAAEIVAHLWGAQARLRKLDFEGARAALGRVPEDSPRPLVGLLRARLETVRRAPQRLAIDQRYALAAEHGWDHDALRFEAAAAVYQLGDFYELTLGYQAMAAMGSRMAEAYYGLARAKAHTEEPWAEWLLRTAWQLHPIERRRIFHDPALAYLSARPGLHRLLELSSPVEPKVGPPAGPRRPLAFPAAARISLCGNRLSLSLGGGRILVPGGGVLAPPETEPEDAGAELRREEGEVLARLDTLTDTASADGLALPLLRRADASSPFANLGLRVRQIELDLRQQTLFHAFESRHFDIRYPASELDRDYVMTFSAILEAERQRLLKWIPIEDDRPIEVHLFPAEDFAEAYSPEDATLLRRRDGKLRLPFVHIGKRPALGMDLAYDLAQAMIFALTGDRAPRWLSEGLSQHVDPNQEVTNPIPTLRAESTLLAFPLIDMVLSGFSEPRLVGLAYDEALWSLHYVEAQRGVAGIHRLLEAFARGKTTEQALAEVFGQSVVEFDAALWRWCTSGILAWDPEKRDYGKETLETVKEAIPELAERIEKQRMPQVGYRQESVEKSTGEVAVRELEAMQAWHGRYLTTVTPVKRSLGVVLQAVNGQAATPLGHACRQLGMDLVAVTTNPDIFAAPDPSVNPPLEAAYQHLVRVATACRQGDDTTFSEHLTQAEKLLATAAQALAKYRLRP